jgi:hypothetical protein
MRPNLRLGAGGAHSWKDLAWAFSQKVRLQKMWRWIPGRYRITKGGGARDTCAVARPPALLILVLLMRLTARAGLAPAPGRRPSPACSSPARLQVGEVDSGANQESSAAEGRQGDRAAHLHLRLA